MATFYQNLAMLLTEGRRFNVDASVRIIVGCCKALVPGVDLNLITPKRIYLSEDGGVQISPRGVVDLHMLFRYTPPELLADFDLNNDSPTGSVFSLGCVLWELIAGTALFGEEAVLTGDVPRLPEAPPELEAILRKALARRVDVRYQTPGELGDALAAYLAANTPN